MRLFDDLEAKVTDEPDEQVRILIHEHIKSFNDAISEHHRTARKSGINPLHILVYGEDGEIIGGLIADTYWGWLDIDDLWLHEEKRGQGLGRAILHTAEQEAKSRNCHYAQLKTFSFQARGFYEKCGYRVTGELKEYPPGHVFYWMCKSLL